METTTFNHGGNLHNHTRRSDSIARKLIRSRQLGLLVQYGLMRLSDLGREGIEHSGSYRFADHIYRNQPSGRGWLGRRIDQKLLALPASQAFRRRYLRAQDCLRERLAAPQHSRRLYKVLSIPCGLPRDVAELGPELRNRIDLTAVDLNPVVLQAAEDYLSELSLGARQFRLGDALEPDAFAEGGYDLVICTGLGEFLDDHQLARLYSNVFDSLATGGVFYTSATDLEPRSEALMRAMELETNYRDRDGLESVFSACGKPWKRLRFEIDPSGLQTFVQASKV